MRKFIPAILLFSSLLLAILFIYEFSTSAIIQSKASFNLSPQAGIIVMGHSHPQCAFNDSLISQLKNVSISGEAYLYTFTKARQILQHNQNIHTVFIEFSNGQLVEKMDDWTWDDKHLKAAYVSLSPFIGFREKWLLLNKNTSGFMSAFSLSSKSRFKYHFKIKLPLH